MKSSVNIIKSNPGTIRSSLGWWLLLAAFVSLPAQAKQVAFELDSSCIVSILNQTITANDEGRFAMPNVPSFMGSIRARATCVRNGQSVSGQSDYFQVVTNDVADAGPFFTVGEETIPRSLAYTVGNSSTIFGVGGTQQLTVFATFADGSVRDVTAADNGMNYTASNSQIVNVSPDGLVTALGAGTSMVTARKDGAIAVLRITVTDSGDSDGDGLPDDFELSVGLNPLDPIDAMEDQDRDGLAALEEFALGTDVINADSDDDGLSDGEEINAAEDGFVTDPLLADTDGDGISDGLEFLAGTDPTDSESGDLGSVLSFITVQPANLALAYNSIDGESKAQLTVTGTLIDGSEIDLTSTNQGTTYESSNISIVSFGAVAGEVFAGREGSAQIAVENNGLSFIVEAEITSFDPTAIAEITVPGLIQGIEVQGDFAYIAADTAGLVIVDIADRSDPVIAATLDTAGEAYELKVDGNYVYLADGSNGFLVIDVSIPTNPTIVSAVNETRARDLDIQDGFVFVASRFAGIEIFNARDPANVFFVSSAGGLRDVRSVAVEDDVMVAINTSTLTSFDISDLQSPMPVDSVYLFRVFDVALDSGIVHLAVDVPVQMYRIQEDLSFIFAGQIITTQNAFNSTEVALADGFAFYAQTTFGSAVNYVNIKDSENPVFQGVLSFPDSTGFTARSVAADSAHVYAGGGDEFRIARYRDLSDPNGFAPTVSMLEPTEGVVAVEGSTIPVSAIASDDIAVLQIELYMDQELVSTDTTYPYRFNLSLPRERDNVEVFVRAFDFGGNSTDSSPLLLELQLDEDGDGLGDDVETSIWFTDPLNSDTDGDGVSDGEEIARGIDPNVSDSDGDGIDDGVEIQNGTDPNNPDTGVLTVIFTSPENNAVGVAENAPIEIVFAERLKRNSVKRSSIRLLEQGQIEIDGNTQLIGDDDRLLFTSSSVLQDFTSYTVILDGVRDLAGNLLAEEYQFSFTTGNTSDTQRPAITFVNPTSGALDVPVNTQISVVFSERIDPRSFDDASIQLRDQVTSEFVFGVATLESDSQVATFTPLQPMAVGREYQISVSGNLTDFFGNSLSPQNYVFTSSFASDLEGPVVQSTTVTEGMTEVPLNSRFNVQFNEAIDTRTLSNVKLVLNEVEVLVDRTVSRDRRLVTLTPRLQLSASTQYLLEIQQVSDLSGNLLLQDVQIEFTTGTDIDVGGVRSRSVTPLNGLSNLPLDTVIEFFSFERLDATTVTEASVFLENRSENNVRVPARVELDSSATRVRLIPESMLLLYHDYTAYFSSSGVYFTDLSGNRVVGTSTRFFTGSNETQQSLSPIATNIDGDYDIPVNSTLRFLFDSPISLGCALNDNVTLSDGVSRIDGVVTLASNGRELSFDPDSNLAGGTDHLLSIGGACGIGGQEVNYQIGFTTSSESDTQRPGFVDITPSHTATLIDVNTEIVVEYNEPIDPTSFLERVEARAIRVYSDFGDIGGTWSFDSEKATFTPYTPLPGDSRINTRINSGSVRDIAGNIRTGTISRYFQTQPEFETTAPTVVSITPNDGAMDIYRKSDVVITFSESLNQQDITRDNFLIYADGQIIEPQVFRSADNRTATLKGTWPAGRPVAVIVTDDVRDMSGNKLQDFVSLFTTAPVGDYTRPRINRSFPSGIEVLPEQSVVLHASEPIDETSLIDSIFVSQDGVLLDGTIEVSGQGRVATFTPDTAFTPGSFVQVNVESTAVDLVGNALYGYQTSFRIADRLSEFGTLPRAQAFSPANGQNDVPLNPIIQIVFNQALNPASVTADRIYLNIDDRVNNIFTVVPANITLTDSNRIVQLRPMTRLLPGTRYELNVRRGIEDADGDISTSQRQIRFNTGEDAVIDDQRPMVIAFSPPNGANNVPLNPRYRAQFDEPIDGISFAQEPGMDVSFAEDNRVVLYSRHRPLPEGLNVTEVMPSVNDFAGNPSVEASTSFQTGNNLDTREPEILSLSPLDRTTIPVNGSIRILFDEVIDPLSVDEQTVLVDFYDDGVRPVAPGRAVVGAGGNPIVWTPDSALAVGRTYLLTVSGVTDLAGNVVDSDIFSIFTDFNSDLQPPEIVAASVVEGQTDIPLNARLRVLFGEQIDRTRLNGVQLSHGGQPIAFSADLNGDGNLLTLTPKQLLPANSTLLFTIADIYDVSGNLLELPAQIGFSTGSGVDYQAGGITDISPGDGTQGVPLNPVIEIRISERIDPVTLNSSSLYLRNETDSAVIPASLGIDSSGQILTLIPDENLDANRLYRVLVGSGDGLMDLGGNRLRSGDSLFTTSDSVATSNPSVIGTSIDQDNNAVPTNSVFSLNFDQPLSTVCIVDSVVSISNGLQTIPVDVEFGADLFEIVVRPQAVLDVSTAYSLNVDGLCDVSGRTLDGYQLDFITGTSTDITAPNLVGFLPNHRSADVPITTEIELEFSEILDGVYFLRQVQNESIRVSSSNGGVAGDWVVSGDRARFTPRAPFPGGARVSISIDRSSIRDVAGNVNSSSYSRYFDTEMQFETEPPTVISVVPGDEAVDIGRSTDIVITFSESISSSDIVRDNFLLYSDGQRLSSSVIRSADNRTVTLKGNWPVGQLVELVISDNVRDLSGNRLSYFTSLFYTAEGVDSQTPSVIRTFPQGGTSGVDPDHPLVIYTNKAMDESSVVQAVRISENGVLVSGSVSISGGRAIHFVPDVPFGNGSLIEIDVGSTALDLSGNELRRFETSYRTATSGSIPNVKPRPVATNPFPNQSGVPLNLILQVEYDQTLDANTIIPANIQLIRRSNGQSIQSTISLESDGRVIQIIPDNLLEISTGYRLTISSGIRDIDSDPPFDSIYALNFATSENSVVDDQPPLVLSISPPDGSQGAPINPRYHVVFDEQVNSISFAREPGMEVGFASESTELLYSRSEPLAADSSIVEVVPQISDLAGNVAVPATTNFQTGTNLETAQPVIEFAHPQSNQTVPVNSEVRVKMSTAIDPLSVSGTSFKITDSRNQVVTGQANLLSDGQTIVWLPENQLGSDERHRIVIGGLTDLSGNTVRSFSRYFYTGTDSDLSPPFVVATTVSEGQSEVPVNVRIRVRFNEPVNLDLLDGITLHVDGDELMVERDASSDGTLMTLTPKQLLPANRFVVLTITDIQDFAQNEMASPVQVEFSTGSNIDFEKGTILQFAPIRNAVDVPRDAVVEFLASERMDPATLDENVVYLSSNSQGSSRVPASLSISEDGRVVTLSPDDLLNSNETYTAAFSAGNGVFDLTGNKLPVTNVRFTVGEDYGLAAPQVTLTNIDVDPSRVTRNVRLLIQFDQVLSGVCLSRGSIVLRDSLNEIPTQIRLETDGRTVKISPDIALAENTEHMLQIDGMCNLGGAEQVSYSIDFATESGTAASRFLIWNEIPDHRSVDVPLDTDFVFELSDIADPIKFYESVSTGRIRVHDSSNADIPGEWELSGQQVIFRPAFLLPPSERIDFRFERGSLRNHFGAATITAYYFYYVMAAM